MFGRRGCLLTLALTATVVSAAWLVLDPQWKDAQVPAALRDLSLRGAANFRPDRRNQPAAVADPALYGPARLAIPVLGVRREQLTDTFEQARGEDRRHEALDIMAPIGTPVIAAGAGRVERLMYSEAGGNTVYIRSPNRRTIYYYAHLDRYAPSLAEGVSVKPGTLLGTVGTTGNADPAGPHLHFAVMATNPERRWWEGATPINPYVLLMGR